MELRKYSADTLNAIKNRQYIKKEEGLDVLIKPIPETDEPGVLDPRFLCESGPHDDRRQGMALQTHDEVWLQKGS